MTKITVYPNTNFGFSDADRQRASGPWFSSFLGTISFDDGNEIIIENSVPIVFLLSSIIESALLIIDLGIKVRVIPIPSTQREILMLAEKNGVILEVRTEDGESLASMQINREFLLILFHQLVELMKDWKTPYRDDGHFAGMNWLVGAALSVGLADGRSPS